MTNETPAQTLARIDEMNARDKELAEGPWCEHYVYSQIRHLVRNCDIWCGEHGEQSDCLSFNKYDGPNIAKMRTDYTALLALVAWQQEVIRDASSEIDHLELCGGAGRKSLDALREQIKEATG